MILLNSIDSVKRYHSTRREKGFCLVDKVKPIGTRLYLVKGSQDYTCDPFLSMCTCPDWVRANKGSDTRVPCKHLYAVYFYMGGI